MTDAEFTESVNAEIHAIARRADLAARIEMLRDDVRQLCDADARLQRERLEVFRRKCAAVAKLYKAESELDALARKGTA